MNNMIVAWGIDYLPELMLLKTALGWVLVALVLIWIFASIAEYYCRKELERMERRERRLQEAIRRLQEVSLRQRTSHNRREN